MTYNKTNYVNDSTPAISAQNLNKSEQGIYDVTVKATDLEDSSNNTVKNLLPSISYYPLFFYGSANTTTGVFVKNSSSTNRLIEMEFLPTSLVSEVHVNYGLQTIVFYYDASFNFVSVSGSWNSAAIIIPDNTKVYFRILLKKSDGSDFASVLNDAFYTINKNFQAATKKETKDMNDAIFDLPYSISANDASMSYGSRWFINQVFDKGWLESIKFYACPKAGNINVELWTKSGSTFTRYFVAEIYVFSGNNEVSIKTDVKKNTYISFATSTFQKARVKSSGSIGSLLLRDDMSSTSFSESSLSITSYDISVDINEYVLSSNNSDTDIHVYHIGENDNVAEVITEAMQYAGSIVYIEPYEHDCIEEWEDFYGDDYFSSMSTGRGLELSNDIHIIGRSGHKLKCYYTGNNDYVMESFSLFNNPQTGSGYTLENLNIETKKIRYCVHDERGSDSTPYKVKYSRCIMSQDQTGSTWDHSRACIGGGMGQHGDIVVEDCIFKTVTSSANMDSLAYHNSSGANAQNSLVIKNCYCDGNSTIQLAAYGDSTAKTKVIVANCSVGSAMEIVDWSGNDNFDIYQINNIVRS